MGEDTGRFSVPLARVVDVPRSSFLFSPFSDDFKGSGTVPPFIAVVGVIWRPRESGGKFV